MKNRLAATSPQVEGVVGAKACVSLRRPSVLLASLVGAGIALGVALYHQSTPETARHAGPEALIDRFEKVAFRDDVTPETERELFRHRLTRWEYPLRLGFSNVASEVRGQAANFTQELEKLIGRRVWIVSPASITSPNIRIVLPSKKEYEHKFFLLKEKNILRRGIEHYACFVNFVKNKKEYHPRIDVVFSPLAEDSDYLNCILEEIIQSLGLMGDTVQDFDSLFVEHRALRLDFPLNDKILLRTLYDPRLSDGMPREQAMIRVREIIPELLAAYEAEGLEGLYQPLRDPSW
ncbi:MAG: DUF2927 domain-containing protein [Marivibrio sp.]|uniref:DUF2927 domain-containing protein n=1 Tax=Marivibrio sp. TaxID=2039719 RepID=UPI0032ED3E60